MGIFGAGLGVAAVSEVGGLAGTVGAATPTIGTNLAPAPVAGGTLSPTKISKFARPLRIMPKMPRSAPNYYEVAVRQFKQEIVPGLDTTVWGYGSVTNPKSFAYPAPTIEATCGTPIKVKWINDLKTSGGKYLQHLLPVDQTLHWANPPGGEHHRDMAGHNPMPYTGPVPLVPHLHGAHVNQDSDGFPEAWFLPNASNIPSSYAKVGSKWDEFADMAADDGRPWGKGYAVYEYPNDQRAGALWFHDHTLGMTRANVYAGPAGMYVIRGGEDDLAPGTLPAGAYEVPLVIQDKSFNCDGSLFFPADRAFFEGLQPSQLQIPFIPDSTLDGGMSDISPIWNPEFFGNTIVVNGRTWPYLNVEKRRYRFRILNASDSRFYILKLSNGAKFWQIGNDGGFLSAPAELDTLLVAPAERADVIIDFGALPAGTRVVLQNIGPDEPFGGGVPGEDFDMAHPGTTGQVMQFRVVARTGVDATVPPSALTLPALADLGTEEYTRQLSLNELMSETVFIPVDANGDPVLDRQGNLIAVPMDYPGADMFGPMRAQLGTVEDGVGVPMPWMDEVTETPVVGRTEVWELYNFTADAHPIHLHQIQFEVLEREDAAGVVTGPEPWETGFKDTVIAYPGDEAAGIPAITRIKMKFDIPGLYVWHCHILSHEDNEMMRPLRVIEE